ncbi:MAG: FHA domain-containing protein, partial [Microcoleus sp. SIO2G3]|nr:FHA domain-containing protein [Microcoleus sp. SIO2G3]
LQLEKTNYKTFASIATRCVTGIIQGQTACLVSNLANGKTQTLLQAQGIWTIGRDRQLSIPIPDRRLSRHHAAIQYIQNQGFYLVDLGSMNGSFVNGEPLPGRHLLRDGDRIRLSNLTFSFFLCNDTQRLEETPPDILAKLAVLTEEAPVPSVVRKSPTTEQADRKEETSHFLQEESSFRDSVLDVSIPQLSPAQQSDILDRFYSRHIQRAIEHN